ncbi:MAG: tetratricopeptide repeat protein [Chloroflexota bacterium]
MRNMLRALPVLLILILAILVPVVYSGYSELQQGDSASSYLEAAQHHQAAAQRIPWRADLYELAGHEYYYAKEYALAETSYQKAFQRNALSADGWVAWGDVHYLMGETDRAAEIWDQGLTQKNPSENLYSRLALIYQAKKEYAKAAEYLQRYVSNHLQDASAHYRLGLLLTLTDTQTAISELITASQQDPELDPAVQTLRTALNLASLSDTPSAKFVITGRGLGLVNEWALAQAAFEQATQADEKNAEAWAWLGEAHQQAGKDEAFTYLERALSLNPNSAVVRTLRGLYFQRVGNNREALTEFQAAAVLQPDDPTLYISIGESFSKLGDMIRALEAYQVATSLAPDEISYWRLLAQFCAQNNIHVKDVGIPAAQKAVVLKADDDGLQDLLGWLLLLDARYPEAERTLLHALELDSQNASAHFHLGMLYLQTNNQVSAREHLVSARDLGNPDAQAVLNQYFP